MRACVVLSLIAVALGGCKRANDKYCDAATPCESGTCNLATNECEAEAADAGVDAMTCGTDDDCTSETSPICGGSGMCRGCNNGSECLERDPATPECETDTGRCVACLDSAMCDSATPICSDGACDLCSAHGECEARDSTAPRCSPEGTCVQCTEHADCTSGVCDRTMHACVDESAIIYVANGGSDEVGCGDLGDECATIGFALDEVTAGRSTVSVASGTYNGTVVADGVTATVVGPTDAIANATTSSQPVLLMINGANLAIDGLTFRGAFGSATEADGVQCSSGSTLVMFETIVRTNEASGIDARNGCVVTLTKVEVTNNGNRGVFVDGGSLVMHRSLVMGNLGGGVDLDEASFEIVNNFIVENGQSSGGGSLVGGVWIALSSTSSPMVFDFNTVAENEADSSVDYGVFCFADMTASNNIVYGGQGRDAVGGNCTWAYSDIEDGEPGTENLDEDPNFIDVSADNYHLAPTSPLKDKADPDATVAVDFDGERRPRGARSDVGADEAPVN